MEFTKLTLKAVLVTVDLDRLRCHQFDVSETRGVREGDCQGVVWQPGQGNRAALLSFTLRRLSRSAFPILLPASRLLSRLITTLNRRPSPAKKLWGSSKVQRHCGCSRTIFLQCVTPSTKGPPRAFDRVDAWWFSDICQDPV